MTKSSNKSVIFYWLFNVDTKEVFLIGNWGFFFRNYKELRIPQKCKRKQGRWIMMTREQQLIALFDKCQLSFFFNHRRRLVVIICALIVGRRREETNLYIKKEKVHKQTNNLIIIIP